MSLHADFLVEIGTEELPPLSMPKLRDAFGLGIQDGLRTAGLEFGEIETFATPRRLAVIVRALQSQTETSSEVLRGPPTKVAFDKDGKPSRAAQAFADKCGVAVDALGREETEKGEWLVHERVVPAVAAVSLLNDIVNQSLAKLPIERAMRWGANEAEFVRPVHWLLMLFGDEIVQGEVFGQSANKFTHGHRFHAPQSIAVNSASDYEQTLESEGKVIASFERRGNRVRSCIEAALTELKATSCADQALYDEVTALVEWPVAVTGNFDEAFLSLPREVLISTLQKHQRYFPVERDGALLAHFITVANIESKAPERIAAGNQRVVTPRLADARFFWDQDRKSTLAETAKRLDNVVFEQGLGSVADKSGRVSTLAVALAKQLGVNSELCERAVMLSRADLVTDMVGEFPDLQGIVGAYYAGEDGEPEDVVSAIRDFYRPGYAGDRLPEGQVARVVAIADRLDTLAGIFARGKKPKGSKDPFGLRRAALGLARLSLEGELDFDLDLALSQAIELQPVDSNPPDLREAIYDFITERLRSYFSERNTGVNNDVFDAVRSRSPKVLSDFSRRLDAVVEFSKLEQATALAAANKRIGNILRKNSTNEALVLNEDVLVDNAEKALFAAYKDCSAKISPLLEQGAYTLAMGELAALRGPIDQFFDEVMVMTDDAAQKQNRLALLAGIRDQFLSIADISVLGRS